MPTPTEQTAPAAWIVRRSDTPAAAVFGLAPEERLRRALERAGCARCEVVTDPAAAAPPASGTVLVFRGDVAFDERLVRGLAATPDVVLVVPETDAGRGWGGPVAAHVEAGLLREALALVAGERADAPAGVRRAAPRELAPAYDAALRKWEAPWVHPVRPERVREIERLLFAASYKGITDLVTRWVWPAPALAAVRWLAARRVHPNTVTLASWVLAIAAALWFWAGSFGWGLLAAWLMTFLDTVDGKLARVTLTSSRVGNVLDHGLDIVHPPFWYLAWGLGVGPAQATATAVVVAGYVVGRLLEGAFLAAFRMETHSWRPIDSLFRTITARRNPNLILLTVGALGGRPDLGLVMVAIWTVVSLGFHTLRLAQAFGARRRGIAIEPWDTAIRRGDAAAPGPSREGREAA